MKIWTVTGGNRDYLSLVAETLQESINIVKISQSEFIGADKFALVVEDFPSAISLRVWMGAPRTLSTDPEQAAINAAHDSEV